MAALWSHAGQDCAPILSSGVSEPPAERVSGDEQAGDRKVSEEPVERVAVSGYGILNDGRIGPIRPRLKLRMLKTRLAILFSGRSGVSCLWSRSL